jgi:murein DD-endopeptidase MepM/ murein hydrolase activator NlpD
MRLPRTLFLGVAGGASGGVLMLVLHLACAPARLMGTTAAAASIRPALSRLLFPVEGAARPGLERSFFEKRGRERWHEAVDIVAPRGTPVRAVNDGTLSRLGRGINSGLAVEQRDPLGAYCYVYAHLDRFAPGLEEGQPIERGQVVGYVGTTGNAARTAPHLHFAVFRVLDQGSCWKGAALNPAPLFE